MSEHTDYPTIDALAMGRPSRRRFLQILGGTGLAAWQGASLLQVAHAQARTRLTVGYMPHPIQVQQLDWMEKGAKALNIELEAPAISYIDYVQSMTAQFLGPATGTRSSGTTMTGGSSSAASWTRWRMV